MYIYITYYSLLIAYWLPFEFPPPHVRGLLGPGLGGTVGPCGGAGRPQRAQHMGKRNVNRQSIGNQSQGIGAWQSIGYRQQACGGAREQGGARVQGGARERGSIFIKITDNWQSDADIYIYIYICNMYIYMYI